MNPKGERGMSEAVRRLTRDLDLDRHVGDLDDSFAVDVRTVLNALAAAEARVEVLTEALRFYADEGRFGTYLGVWVYVRSDPERNERPGDAARAALAADAPYTHDSC